jgi:hypothetical protein
MTREIPIVAVALLLAVAPLALKSLGAWLAKKQIERMRP